MLFVIISSITNLLFLICGYIFGSKTKVITIQKGDTVSKPHIDYKYDDEEATVVTPEMELEYEDMIKKQSGDYSGLR